MVVQHLDDAQQPGLFAALGAGDAAGVHCHIHFISAAGVLGPAVRQDIDGGFVDLYDLLQLLDLLLQQFVFLYEEFHVFVILVHFQNIILVDNIK